jgi:hypothetical protein
VVIATVGNDEVGFLARPAPLAGNWSCVEIVEQRK